MAFDPGLEQGDVLDNQELCRRFVCGARGGMRRSHATDSLVIISDNTKPLYRDWWIDGILHYTGMGRIGDQSLNSSQNRTLNQSDTNNVGVFLFEVFERGKYVYRGRVRLAGKPYQENQRDAKGNMRQVWVFPLEFMDRAPSRLISEEDFRKEQERREKVASALSPEELAKRARGSPAKPAQRQVMSSQYERNEYVAELAKRNADGICQLCGEPAPFNTRKGGPYLEAHHIDWLSKGGEDAIYNAVALCPNCHRKMHILDAPADRASLKKKAKGAAGNQPGS